MCCSIVSQEEFDALYRVDKFLGAGTFGTVFSGQRVADQCLVAIKNLQQPRWPYHPREQELPKEVLFLRQLSHVPGVIGLVDCFQLRGAAGFRIVMETVSGGGSDLFDFITQQGTLQEDLARHFFSQLVTTVQHIHRAGVAHLDIKSDNVLVDLSTRAVKLIDFGSAAKFQKSGYRHFPGPLVHAPPEWLKHHRYTAEGLAVWSLGLLLYEMLLGVLPFATASEIRRGKLHHLEGGVTGVSDAAQQVIRACLAVSRLKRLTLCQVTHLDWLQACPGASLPSTLPQVGSSPITLQVACE